MKVLIISTITALLIMAAATNAGATIEGHRAVDRVFGNNPTARCVAYTESRFRPWVRNPSGASGLFQIMPSVWDGKFVKYNGRGMIIRARYLLRARYNARAAYFISKGGHNWSAWNWECS